MGLLAWLRSHLCPAPTPTPAPTDALAAAILAQVTAGQTVSFALDPRLTNLVRVTVAGAAGSAAQATCSEPALLAPALAAARPPAAAGLSPADDSEDPVNFTVFANQARDAATYTSPTVDYTGAGATVGYAIASDTWKTDDPSVLVSVTVQQNFNDGSGWTEVFGFTCNPGQVDKFGNPPSGSFVVNDDLGERQVRALMTLSGPLTLGLNGSTAVLT